MCRRRILVFIRATGLGLAASKALSWMPSNRPSNLACPEPRRWPRPIASRKRMTTSLLAAAVTLGWMFGATAAPIAPRDPPQSAERIDRLPPEVRRVVVARCGAHAEAGHYFATYEHDSHVIHLDYSLLYCPGAPSSEESHGLRQTFVRRQGGYALSEMEVEVDRGVSANGLSPVSHRSARRSGSRADRSAFAER